MVDESSNNVFFMRPKPLAGVIRLVSDDDREMLHKRIQEYHARKGISYRPEDWKPLFIIPTPAELREANECLMGGWYGDNTLSELVLGLNHPISQRAKETADQILAVQMAKDMGDDFYPTFPFTAIKNAIGGTTLTLKFKLQDPLQKVQEELADKGFTSLAKRTTQSNAAVRVLNLDGEISIFKERVRSLRRQADVNDLKDENHSHELLKIIPPVMMDEAKRLLLLKEWKKSEDMPSYTLPTNNTLFEQVYIALRQIIETVNARYENPPFSFDRVPAISPWSQVPLVIRFSENAPSNILELLQNILQKQRRGSGMGESI